MSEKNYGNNSQLGEIVKYINDNIKVPVLGAGGGFAPIGAINSYMGTTAPIGWLICDGQTYNITDYPELATHIASHFGSTNFFGGDGTTTFAVPDTTDITSTTLENGVYIIKSTLSDAEIANMQVYSPVERQIGYWQEYRTVEGQQVLMQKPLYFRVLRFSYNQSGQQLDVTVGEMPNYETAEIRRCHGMNNQLRNEFITNDLIFCHPTDSRYSTGYYYAEPYFKILCGSSNAIVNPTFFVHYTKTTDQWQTV